MQQMTKASEISRDFLDVTRQRWYIYLLSLVVQLDKYPTGQEVAGEIQEIRVIEEYQKLAEFSRHDLMQHVAQGSTTRMTDDARVRAASR